LIIKVNQLLKIHLLVTIHRIFDVKMLQFPYITIIKKNLT